MKMNIILQCRVCNMPKVKPLSLVPCNHSFCEGCVTISNQTITTSKRQNKSKHISNCPTCSEQVRDANPNPEIYSLIELDKNNKLAYVPDCSFEYHEIIEHRRDTYGNLFYHIHWKNGEKTWEPVSSLIDEDDVYIEYKKG